MFYSFRDIFLCFIVFFLFICRGIVRSNSTAYVLTYLYLLFASQMPLANLGNIELLVSNGIIQHILENYAKVSEFRCVSFTCFSLNSLRKIAGRRFFSALLCATLVAEMQRGEC